MPDGPCREPDRVLRRTEDAVHTDREVQPRQGWAPGASVRDVVRRELPNLARQLIQLSGSRRRSSRGAVQRDNGIANSCAPDMSTSVVPPRLIYASKREPLRGIRAGGSTKDGDVGSSCRSRRRYVRHRRSSRHLEVPHYG